MTQWQRNSLHTMTHAHMHEHTQTHHPNFIIQLIKMHSLHTMMFSPLSLSLCFILQLMIMQWRLATPFKHCTPSRGFTLNCIFSILCDFHWSCLPLHIATSDHLKLFRYCNLFPLIHHFQRFSVFRCLKIFFSTRDHLNLFLYCNFSPTHSSFSAV